MWRRPQMDPFMDPAEIRTLAAEFDNPYDPDHFLTPLERAMLDLYKARPVRMKRFVKEFRWVQAEIRRRGVEV